MPPNGLLATAGVANQCLQLSEAKVGPARLRLGAELKRVPGVPGFHLLRSASRGVLLAGSQLYRWTVH